jgi:hypothetical protein
VIRGGEKTLRVAGGPPASTFTIASRGSGVGQSG